MSDLNWRDVRHNFAAAGRSLIGRWRLTAAAFAVAVLMSMGSLAASSSAAATSSSPAVPVAVHAKSAAFAESWKYVGEYFWHSSCKEAGENGKRGGAWRDYKCINGSWWDNYELWVLN